jgi:hypothetical protein
MNTARAPTATHAKCTLDEQPFTGCHVTIKQRFLTVASTTYNLHIRYAVIIREYMQDARENAYRQRQRQGTQCHLP